MEITRVSDGEIIKDTEILPKAISGDEDNLFRVQILHYIEPGQNDEDLIGDYILRIYSEYGSSGAVEEFSVLKSSMPIIVTQNEVEELETPEELETLEELETPEELVTPEEYYDDVEDSIESAKIPSWVHDIFVWYANETISENELLAAIEYLISQGTINVNSN